MKCARKLCTEMLGAITFKFGGALSSLWIFRLTKDYHCYAPGYFLETNFLSFKFRSSQGSRNLNRLKELQSRGWIQTFLFIFFYHMFLRNRNSNDVAKQN